jgi:hypothetical protein
MAELLDFLHTPALDLPHGTVNKGNRLANKFVIIHLLHTSSVEIELGMGASSDFRSTPQNSLTELGPTQDQQL